MRGSKYASARRPAIAPRRQGSSRGWHHRLRGHRYVPQAGVISGAVGDASECTQQTLCRRLRPGPEVVTVNVGPHEPRMTAPRGGCVETADHGNQEPSSRRFPCSVSSKEDRAQASLLPASLADYLDAPGSAVVPTAIGRPAHHSAMVLKLYIYVSTRARGVCSSAALPVR
jgi:hypothetical protein